MWGGLGEGVVEREREIVGYGIREKDRSKFWLLDGYIERDK